MENHELIMSVVYDTSNKHRKTHIFSISNTARWERVENKQHIVLKSDTKTLIGVYICITNNDSQHPKVYTCLNFNVETKQVHHIKNSVSFLLLCQNRVISLNIILVNECIQPKP